MHAGPTAKLVRLDKDKHPEKYCPHTRCLWRTGGPLCKRHARALATGRMTEEDKQECRLDQQDQQDRQDEVDFADSELN